MKDENDKGGGRKKQRKEKKTYARYSTVVHRINTRYM